MVKPSRTPNDIRLAPNQLEALRAVASNLRTWQPLESLTFAEASTLRDLELIELKPPADSQRYETRALRALIPDERPWRVRITELGRQVLRAQSASTRPLVIYHGPSCADGFAAAWVAHRYFESRGGCELVPANYGDEPPAVDGRDVVILDFSYPRDVLLEMHEQARSLILLDHHRTAEENLRGLPFATFDMGRSGAGLAWDHFFPFQRRPWLVDYVEDRDLWKWAQPRSRAVNAFVRTVPFDLAAWTRLAEEPLDQVADRGEAILAYIGQWVKAHAANAASAELAGHVVPVVNATATISEVGNELAQAAPFAATYIVRPDGSYQYSLRSERSNPDHVDVSEIARAFGGGGHRNAAGFRSSGPVHTPIEPEAQASS